MALTSRVLSWWHNVPLPALADARPQFQAWHAFDESSGRWVPRAAEQRTGGPETFSLVTWNVDAVADHGEARIEAILAHVLSSSETPTPDVVFFQEVTRAALASILADRRIRDGWLVSDATDAKWRDVKFQNITLVSRRMAVGPVWRTKYPTRFGRDALCCDVFAGDRQARMRLVNVHLDSLPVQPSLRPRQMAVVAATLRAAGRGLVAGDFNPVLPEDESLIADNGLADAWVGLYPGDPGYTWGEDGMQPFPAARLDRIATVGMLVRDVAVLQPGVETSTGGSPVPWSDHSGLKCLFTLSVSVHLD